MARDFDGVDDIVTLGAGGVLNDMLPFTFCAWMAPDTVGESATGNIVAKHSGGGSATSGGWYLRTQNTVTVSFVRRYLSNNLIRNWSILTLTDGTYHHVGLTWNGSQSSTAATAMELYVNGVTALLTLTQTGRGAFQTDSAWTLALGNPVPTNASFDGRLAHVHLFRRQLSGNEIRALMFHPAMYAQGSVSAVNTVGLVGYWPLGGLGSPEPDLSGNQIPGVVTGAVYSAQEAPVNDTFVVAAPQMGYAS